MSCVSNAFRTVADASLGLGFWARQVEANANESANKLWSGRMFILRPTEHFAMTLVETPIAPRMFLAIG
jgi:hypothetical protein